MPEPPAVRDYTSDLMKLQEALELINEQRRQDIEMLTATVTLSHKKYSKHVKKVQESQAHKFDSLKADIDRDLKQKATPEDVDQKLLKAAELFRMTAMQIGELCTERVGKLETQLEEKVRDRSEFCETIQMRYEELITRFCEPQNALI